MDYAFLQTLEKYFENHSNQLNAIFSDGQHQIETKGNNLTLEEHIRGLVYSKLSQGVKWKESVESKQDEIDRLFNDFTDIDFIRQTSAEELYHGLCRLRVGRFRKDLAYNLHDNINILENLLKDKECSGSYEYIQTLSGQLKGFGIALVCEYLSWLKIDRIKPDIHIKRFLKRYYGRPFSDKDVIEFGTAARNATAYNLTQIDALVWSYCADGYAEICASKPACDKCCIKDKCKAFQEQYSKHDS